MKKYLFYSPSMHIDIFIEVEIYSIMIITINVPLVIKIK